MSAYLAAVLADTPVHYWRMADPGGALAFDIGSSPNQLYSFGQTQPGYKGPITDGLSGYFNNGPYYRSFKSFAQNPPYTFECLAFPVQFPNDQIAFYGTLSLGIRADGTPLITTPGSALTVAAPVLPLEKWVHLAASVDAAGNRKVYANGSLVSSDVHAVANATNPWTIGSQNGIAYFSGFIAEVAYYSYIVSAARIAVHAAALDFPNGQPSYALQGTIASSGAVPTTLPQAAADLTALVSRTYLNSV